MLVTMPMKQKQTKKLRVTAQKNSRLLLLRFTIVCIRKQLRLSLEWCQCSVKSMSNKLFNLVSASFTNAMPAVAYKTTTQQSQNITENFYFFFFFFLYGLQWILVVFFMIFGKSWQLNAWFLYTKIVFLMVINILLSWLCCNAGYRLAIGILKKF